MYRIIMQLSKDLVAASAAPLILSILRGGESYGYAIIQRVRELSGGQIEWTDGMLYPVLHRLEAQGYIVSRHGRPRPAEETHASITRSSRPGKKRWPSTRRSGFWCTARWQRCGADHV